MLDTLNTLLTPNLISLIVATGIGLIIGLEREFRKAGDKDHFAGIRTFPLVSILGCIITFATHALSPWLLVTISFSLLLFVSVTYYVRSKSGHLGITTEISLVITFILGAMTSLHLIREALAAAVITTTLLSLKGQFRYFVSKITEDELFAFIKFIILCMLLVPFLPDAAYGPNGLLNPRDIGFIVVIVSSLSFIGYLLIKFTGANRGILLTAFFGGLFSSTAVTWVFSSKSRTSGGAFSVVYAAGVILASSIMFLRAALVAFIFNKMVFFQLIVPCVIMAAVGFGFTFFLMRKEKNVQSPPSIELGNPINILNALGFGFLYIAIVLFVFYANEYFGRSGLMLSGFISGLADVDAITISMSKLATASKDVDISVLVVLLAMMSNTIVKIGLSLAKGTPELRKRVLLALSAAILAGAFYTAVIF